MNILYVQGAWENGGIEKVVDTYCHKIVSDGMKADIFTFELKDSVFTKELNALGVDVFTTKKVIKGGYLKHNIERLKAFLELPFENYDIVHYNTSFALAYIHCWFLKRENRQIKVILHSHGDDVNAPYLHLKRLFNMIVKHVFQNVPDYCIGCSDAAGKWLFSKRNLTKKYSTLMNAIDFEKYRVDKSVREKYRTQWNITRECMVIGTIGRFNYQKNPFFILEIIDQLAKKVKNFKFIWIGTGENKEEIVKLAKQKKIQDKIVFIEQTNDVVGCLSAFDMMVLPSKYEGLPLVMLEAQASGLITLVSDTITDAAKMSEQCEYLSIKNVHCWVDRIISLIEKSQLRYYPENELVYKMFDVNSVVEKLERVYKEC